jgi:hypothetical protein
MSKMRFQKERERNNMQNNCKKVLGFVAIGVLAGLCLIPVASASVIGNLSENSCTTGGTSGVTVTASTITWLPAAVSPPNAGCITSGNGTTLTYNSGTPLGTTAPGTIMDLTLNPSFPPVNDFMEFVIGSTTVDFELTSIGPGSSNTNCAALTIGQACSVANSPFILALSGTTSSVIYLAVGGQVTDNGTTWNNWTGVFSTTIPNQTPAQIQSIFGPGGVGSLTSTQSGTFTATVLPEPASMTLLGAGLLAIAMAARKRRKA